MPPQADKYKFIPKSYHTKKTSIMDFFRAKGVGPPATAKLKNDIPIKKNHQHEQIKPDLKDTPTTTKLKNDTPVKENQQHKQIKPELKDITLINNKYQQEQNTSHKKQTE